MIFERYLGESVGVVSLVDHFAQVRGTRGANPAPFPPLQFHLVEKEVQAVMTELEPPIELFAQGAAMGAFWFADEGRIGQSERMRIEPGRYRLRVESDYYQTLDVVLQWPPLAPDPPQNVPIHLLRPGYAYPFPDVTLPSARVTIVRGVLLQGVDGRPVPNAAVEIMSPPNLGPFVSAVTDAQGRWALAFRHNNLNPIVAEVTITKPPNAPLVVANVDLRPGADNALSYTALRGAALYANGDRARSAEITLDIAAGTVFTDADGRWTFYLGFQEFPANTQAQVTALAPNGNSESVIVQIRNRATVVVPTFHIAN